MEILIVGGILVALMVYASTKIKKTAAQAYEREVIETEDFRLVKPEGFINPVNEDSEYAFEGLSKDFGGEDAHNIRQAQIQLRIFSGENFDKICREARQSFDKISSEKTLNGDSENRKIYLAEGEKIENKIPFYVARKIVENHANRKIYDLKILVLQDNKELYDERIAETLDGFSLK
jgi:hypothetical protein